MIGSQTVVDKNLTAVSFKNLLLGDQLFAVIGKLVKHAYRYILLLYTIHRFVIGYVILNGAILILCQNR